MGVVDHAEHRLLFGGRREQAQDAAEDGQTLTGLVRAERERSAERDRLRVRNRLEERERRPQQLVQSRERDLDLRFHPERAKDTHVQRPLDGGVQQGGLADAGLTAEHERAASTLSCRIQHLVDLRRLEVAAKKHRA